MARTTVSGRTRSSVGRILPAALAVPLLCSGLLVAGWTGQASTSTGSVYAAPTAQGAGNCTSPANACTLATAVGGWTPGDVIQLTTSGNESQSSTFYSGGVSVDAAGTTATDPVTIEPASGVTDPILDGGGSKTVIDVAGPVYLDVDDVTIQHGGNAGMTNDAGGTVDLDDVTFSDNANPDDNGGAIQNGEDGTGILTVTDSTFTGNTSGYSGGAIMNGVAETTSASSDGILAVSDSTFSDNTTLLRHPPGRGWNCALQVEDGGHVPERPDSLLGRRHLWKAQGAG